MSTSNLLHPNDYDLFVGTINTSNGVSSFRQPLVQTTLAGTGLPVLTGWSIHGAPGAVNMLGGLMSYIDFSIFATIRETVIVATIPYFQISTISGTNPDVTTINFAIPSSVTPSSAISSGTVICYGKPSTTQNIVTARVLNTGILEIKSLNGALLYDHTAASDFGTIDTDLCITWTIPG